MDRWRSSLSAGVWKEYGDHGMTWTSTTFQSFFLARSTANSTARVDASLLSTPTTTVSMTGLSLVG